jgi:hypothetical protein
MQGVSRDRETEEIILDWLNISFIPATALYFSSAFCRRIKPGEERVIVSFINSIYETIQVILVIRMIELVIMK